jgi:hypothetical protein
VSNRPDVVKAGDDALGYEQADRKLAIHAGRPHGDDEWRPIETDLERLLDDGEILPAQDLCAAGSADAEDID